MKKMFSLMLALMMMVTLTACGDDPAKSTQDESANKAYTVGLLQLVEHPSLDEIRTAIIDEIAARGYADAIQVEYENGQNDQSNMNTIVQKFIADDVDAIVPIATLAAQSAAAATTEIPIIFSAVTDPVAASVVSDLEHPDGNISGISDYIDVSAIFALAEELTPDVKSYGLLYNMGEVNSVSVISEVKAYLEAKGLPYTEAFVTNIGEVTTAMQSLVGKVDAVFVPIDNTVASAMSNVAEIANANKMPIYAAADSLVHDGALATVGVNYTQLGKQTADMLIRVLIDGESIADNPVEVMEEYAVTVNPETAAALGVDVSKYTE